MLFRSKTISPSIDILISSNLERFLYLLTNGNHAMVRRLFDALGRDRCFTVDEKLRKQIQGEVQGDWTNEQQCLEMIKTVYDETQQLIDPHTAVAVHVADKFTGKEQIPMLISATAHYGKFPQTMLQMIGDPARSTLSNDVSVLLEDLRALQSSSPMHHGLIQLPTKVVKHTKTVQATKSAIVGEINSFLEGFSKQHAS